MSDRVRRWVLYALWLGMALLPLVDGWSYYLTPIQERPDSPLYDLYRPSGFIGHGLGIVGSLMIIVGVSMYSLRKRWSVLQGWGRLPRWLRAHIFLCTLGPFLVLLHTTFKLGNVAAIAFWSMAIVVSSGIFGRYVYARIPKTIHGEFRSEAEVRRTLRAQAEEIAEETVMEPREVRSLIDEHVPTPPAGVVRAVAHAVRFRWRKGRLREGLRRALRERGQEEAKTNGDTSSPLELLMESAQLKHRHSLLAPFQRLFGYWHVLHIPLATVMFVTLAIHVAVAVTFGYTWIF